MRTMIADKVLALAGTLIQWCMDALEAAIWESRETTARSRCRTRSASRPKVSGTDLDTDYVVPRASQRAFFHLDHCTVDRRLGIITVT
jgi:hypothetical protein